MPELASDWKRIGAALTGTGSRPSGRDASRVDPSRTELQRLREFVGIVMREGPWAGGEWEGGALQELALKCGLLVRVPYDPEVHGESEFDAEPGDDWYVLAWSDHAPASCDGSGSAGETACGLEPSGLGPSGEYPSRGDLITELECLARVGRVSKGVAQTMDDAAGAIQEIQSQRDYWMAYALDLERQRNAAVVRAEEAEKLAADWQRVAMGHIGSARARVSDEQAKPEDAQRLSPQGASATASAGTPSNERPEKEGA